MLIRRCAWHPEFYGYPLVYGVASWRMSRVRFTDGLCRFCAARVKADEDDFRPSARRGFGVSPAFVAAATVLLVLSPQSVVTDENQAHARRNPVPATLSVPAAEAEEPPRVAIRPAPPSRPVSRAVVARAPLAAAAPVAEPPRRVVNPAARERTASAPPFTRLAITHYQDPASPLSALSAQAP